MRNKAPILRIAWGYASLIGLAVIQQLVVYLKIYMNQSYTTLDVVFSIVSLAALILGFVIPVGVSVVAGFIYLVSYFVWLVTYADVSVLTFSWWLLIPANVAVAAFIKASLVRNARVMERLQELQERNPEIDLDTSLGNKDALADTLVKQSNLARRYSEQYGFSMAMFKIEFCRWYWNHSVPYVMHSSFLNYPLPYRSRFGLRIINFCGSRTFCDYLSNDQCGVLAHPDTTDQKSHDGSANHR